MNDDACVYVLGAGASKQDGLPLTTELKHGVAWAIVQDRPRFAVLARHLQHLYDVQDDELQQSGRIWESLRARSGDRPASDRNQLPDVIDLLSTLDWVLREQSSFGPGAHSGNQPGRSSAEELADVRDLVVQALCYCLGMYGGQEAATTRGLLELVTPGDSLITTNWDLLLDSVRDTRFGSAPQDYGTTGNVVLEGATHPLDSNRPKLLKLHGSLSWRYCQRCQRLSINPHDHVAGERQKDATCLCTHPFSELIVTPGFVREYRNVHLLNIWREALLTLAQARRWVFVGYSLPPDDIGVRTLLLRARCVRQDVVGDAPLVTVVTSPVDQNETLARYRRLFPHAESAPGDFGDFVQRARTTP